MINEALRLFRIYNDLKLNELSKAIDLSSSYISEIEKGKKEPTLKVLNKYSEYFNIPVSSILQFSEKLEIDDKSLKSKIANNLITFLKNVEINGS